MSRGGRNAVDVAKTAAAALRDEGQSFFSTIVVLGGGAGAGVEVTDLINAMHFEGWKVQSVTAMSQFSVLIVFQSTVHGVDLA